MPFTGLSLDSGLGGPRSSYWTTIRPVYRNHLPPCGNACPAGEQIATYLRLIREGQPEQAWRIILQDNPLPGVHGRVCYHPCEGDCNRGLYDEAIAIHAAERYAADRCLTLPPQIPEDRPKNGLRVAVVGSGPSGLSCAYQLARKGYSVTIFEAAAEPGGMLRLGIPRYRLPREVLDKEIADIEAWGVRILTRQRLGAELSIEDLETDGFSAVFLGVGAMKARPLGAAGERLPGVWSGLEFLARVNAGERPRLGRRVGVIGGGNTAMDVVRCAVRLGSAATVVYRRTRTEMPAIAEEIAEAAHEGVQFQFLLSPLSISREPDGLLRLECARMQLQAPDASGRRAVVESPGETTTLTFDSVVLAIGEEADLSCLPPELSASGVQLAVDHWGRTSRRGVFAGGDVASTARRVVDAVGSGKRAALGIDHYVRGLAEPTEQTTRVIPVREIDLTQFPRASRASLSQLPPGEGLADFQEVNLPLQSEQACQEAIRCFSCGVCTYCDRCMLYCPDLAIARLARVPDPLAVGYQINIDRCKGCRLCVELCPREAMEMVGAD